MAHIQGPVHTYTTQAPEQKLRRTERHRNGNIRRCGHRTHRHIRYRYAGTGRRNHISPLVEKLPSKGFVLGTAAVAVDLAAARFGFVEGTVDLGAVGTAGGALAALCPPLAALAQAPLHRYLRWSLDGASRYIVNMQ